MGPLFAFGSGPTRPSYICSAIPSPSQSLVGAGVSPSLSRRVATPSRAREGGRSPPLSGPAASSPPAAGGRRQVLCFLPHPAHRWSSCPCWRCCLLCPLFLGWARALAGQLAACLDHRRCGCLVVVVVMAFDSPPYCLRKNSKSRGVSLSGRSVPELS